MFAKTRLSRRFPFVFFGIFVLLATAFHPQAGLAQADSPTPPAQPVKLMFIHHSTGEN